MLVNFTLIVCCVLNETKWRIMGLYKKKQYIHCIRLIHSKSSTASNNSLYGAFLSYLHTKSTLIRLHTNNDILVIVEWESIDLSQLEPCPSRTIIYFHKTETTTHKVDQTLTRETRRLADSIMSFNFIPSLQEDHTKWSVYQKAESLYAIQKSYKTYPLNILLFLA